MISEKISPIVTARLWRGFLLLLIFMAAAATSGQAPAPKAEKNDERPNIVVISIDTLRADRLGLYGYHRDTTPFLDSIASKFTVFEECHVHASWTAPSVASLFTGLYPSQHGSLGKDRVVLSDKNTTMAEILSKAGYYSAAFSASPFIHPDFGFGQGFDFFESDFTENAAILNDKIFASLDGLEQKNKDKPLFVYIMYFDPHFSYKAPEQYSEKFNSDGRGRKLWDKSRVTRLDSLFELGAEVGRETFDFLNSSYDGEISYTDEHLARLVTVLTKRGIYRAGRDVLIITSDHGEEFLEHAAFGHGNTLYQETVKVPLLIAAPGVKPGRIKKVVRQVDLLPTVLGLAEVSTQKNLEGESLAPFLRGEEDSRDRPAYAICRHLFHEGRTMRSLRLGDHKLIVGKNPDGAELFNLANDPDEQKNLAFSDHEFLKDMIRSLMDFESQIAPPVAGVLSTASPERTEDLFKALGYIDD